MTGAISVKFSDYNNATGTIKVENTNIIKNIFSHYSEEKGLTSMEFRQLENIAAIAGNNDVLEAVDISNGKNRLKSDVVKGNASISIGLVDWIKGDGTIYLKIPKGTSMAEVKSMYNLPDGSLRNYCREAGSKGGDFDKFKTIADQVWFSISDFAKGNNMTPEEVKELFNK